MKRFFLIIALGAFPLPAERIATIEVEGMTCPLCTVAIKRSLTHTPGVLKAKVRLNTRKATVRTVDDLNETELLKAIEKVGYKGKILRIENAKSE